MGIIKIALLRQTKTNMNTQKLINFVKSNKDGFTVEYDTLKNPNHKNGFYIGISNNKGDDLKTVVRNLIKSKDSIFKDIPLFIGGWVDIKNSMFYLDLSVHTDNAQKAVFLCKLFNQKAYFDIAKMDSIYIN